MIYDNWRAISTLNNLIETCKDGEQGFRAAAEGVRDNPELKLLLHAYAQERAQFAAELQAEVLRLGGDPERDGSLGGAMHRGWMSFKAAVTRGDEGTVLSEREAREDAAVAAYDEALRGGDLAPLQRDIVARQRMEVKKVHYKIRTLRDATREVSRGTSAR